MSKLVEKPWYTVEAPVGCTLWQNAEALGTKNREKSVWTVHRVGWVVEMFWLLSALGPSNNHDSWISKPSIQPTKQPTI